MAVFFLSAKKPCCNLLFQANSAEHSIATEAGAYQSDKVMRPKVFTENSEQARVLGVDFHSVFARGSQFKVESLVFRIAKPENYILPSPSRKEVGYALVLAY